MQWGSGFASAAFVAAFTMATDVHAEESDHDRAIALFAEARKLIEAGDCTSAVPKLQESVVMTRARAYVGMLVQVLVLVRRIAGQLPELLDA